MILEILHKMCLADPLGIVTMRHGQNEYRLPVYPSNLKMLGSARMTCLTGKATI